MPELEDVPLVHKSKAAGVLAVFLATLSVLAVLCFHFPEYLTTPELRRSYDVALLRRVLEASMLVAAVLGSWALLSGRAKRLGIIAIGLTLVAVWMGGANVQVDD